MSETQTNGSYPPSYPPAQKSMFATKVPSAVTFAVGVLLFFMPFAELKCKYAGDKEENQLIRFSGFHMAFVNTGFGLALGSNWRLDMPGGGGLSDNNSDYNFAKKEAQSQKANPYAIAALLLAIAGLALSFTSRKIGSATGMIAGILSAASLIGLMIDLKNKSSGTIKGLQEGANRFNKDENVVFSLDFTPWFYIALVALIVAAIFSYMRMRQLEK